MSFPKEDMDELTLLEVKQSPKSFLSSTTLSVDSDEDSKHLTLEYFEDGETLLERVLEWFHEQGIEKGDPASIQEDYLAEKRRNVAQALKSSGPPNHISTVDSDKKTSLKLRRPLTLKVTLSNL